MPVSAETLEEAIRSKVEGVEHAVRMHDTLSLVGANDLAPC